MSREYASLRKISLAREYTQRAYYLPTVAGGHLADARFAVLEAPKQFIIDRAAIRTPLEDEVRVRVHDCGVCGSDLKMWAGTHAFLRPPLLIGHEVYGTVDEPGSGTNGLDPGTPVVVFPPIGCGNCHHCRASQPQLCADMQFVGGQLPGGLAEYLHVPAKNLISVPQEIRRHERVLVEPLAVGVHAVARAEVAPGEMAVVIGSGAIGLFTALAALAKGASPVLVGELSAPRRARAEALGLDAFDAGAISVSDAVAARIRPEGADVVFECVGSQATIGAALAATRKGGRAVLVGNAPASIQIDGLALQRGDRSLVGVLMYDRSDLLAAMEMLANGLLEALGEDDVVQPYGLDEVGAAFEAAKDGSVGAVRAVVRP
jgi:threonine dehydrogenase-like Zn-dependent dehydrogenase